MRGLGIQVNYAPALKRAQRRIETQARFATAAAVWGKMNRAFSAVIAETPAWTGDTLANYDWGIGKRSTDYRPLNQNYSWRAPIFPVDDPGRYIAISRANLDRMRSEVFRDPYRNFVLYNAVQYENGATIRDLEYGSLTGTAHLMFTKAKAVLEMTRV